MFRTLVRAAVVAAALPIALESREPSGGALTGTGRLRRDPADRPVIDSRASGEGATWTVVVALPKPAGGELRLDHEPHQGSHGFRLASTVSSAARPCDRTASRRHRGRW